MIKYEKPDNAPQYDQFTDEEFHGFCLFGKLLDDNGCVDDAGVMDHKKVAALYDEAIRLGHLDLGDGYKFEFIGFDDDGNPQFNIATAKVAH